MKRKTEIVEITILDVNDQEDSPVLNIRVDYPEIVKNKYKYGQYSNTFHIYYKEPRIVLCLDNAMPIVTSDIDLLDQAKHYASFGEEFESVFKKLIEVTTQQVVYRFVTEVILSEGFKGFTFKSETGGIINEDIEEFAYYLCRTIGITQGYIIPDPELSNIIKL